MSYITRHCPLILYIDLNEQDMTKGTKGPTEGIELIWFQKFYEKVALAHSFV